MPKLDGDSPGKPAPGRHFRFPPNGPERDDIGVTLRPVRVGTGSADEEGRLVLHGGKLVAVLVRLSDEHGDLAGRWFLEHGFGRLDDPWHPTFDGLDPACAWIARHLGHGPTDPL